VDFDTRVDVPVEACGSVTRLVGDAECIPGAIRLTHASSCAVAGGAYYATPISLDGEPSLSIDVQLLIDGTGDGMAVVLQSDPRGASAVGDNGGGLGIACVTSSVGCVTPSVAVELDAFVNPGIDPGIPQAQGADPDVDHVGIDLDGDVNSRETATLGFDLERVPFWVSIRHDGPSRVLTITAGRTITDAPPVLTATVDLTELGPSAWLGVTAGCGGDVANQDVLAWSFSVH
jgi:hypothetical protein